MTITGTDQAARIMELTDRIAHLENWLHELHALFHPIPCNLPPGEG